MSFLFRCLGCVCNIVPASDCMHELVWLGSRWKLLLAEDAVKKEWQCIYVLVLMASYVNVV